MTNPSTNTNPSSGNGAASPAEELDDIVSKLECDIQDVHYIAVLLHEYMTHNCNHTVPDFGNAHAFLSGSLLEDISAPWGRPFSHVCQSVGSEKL